MVLGLQKLVRTTRLVCCRLIAHDVVTSLTWFTPWSSDAHKIEEVGSANFFGITANNEFCDAIEVLLFCHLSPSTLCFCQQNTDLVWAQVKGCLYQWFGSLWPEAGACGTTRLSSLRSGGVQHGDDFHVFYSETGGRSCHTETLWRDWLVFQLVMSEAPEGWVVKVIKPKESETKCLGFNEDES